MTPEDWDKVKQEMGSIWGAVNLRCDQYAVQLRVRLYKELRWCIVIYIEGSTKGLFGVDKEDEKLRKFSNANVRHLYRRKDRSQKRMRIRKSLGMDPDPVSTVYTPIWLSFAPLKRHLIANNTEVELLAVGADCVQTQKSV